MKLSRNFSRSEFACKCGCGFDTVDYELLNILQDIRDRFQKPIEITSAARCIQHNKSVGGSKNSQHLYGRAADIVVKGVSPSDVINYLDIKYPNKLGLGRYNSFTHIDTRTNAPARW